MVLKSVLEKLHAAGLIVEAIDGRLKVTPASRITAEITDTIRAHKVEILALLTASTPTFDTDDPTWPRRKWCRVYRHRYGWRDVHDAYHCLTCCQPALSAPVAAITEVISGEIVEHNPFLLKDDPDVIEFVCERAGIRQHDGGLDQPEAERMAALDYWVHLSTCKGRA